MTEEVLREWLASEWVEYGFQCKRFEREPSAEEFLNSLVRKRYGKLGT